MKPVETRAGGSHEPRVALALFFDVHGTVWRAVNTHLDPVDGDSRAQEIAALLGVVREEKSAGHRSSSAATSTRPRTTR